MEDMLIVVDGFTHHNRQLKVSHPDAPGRFITAHIVTLCSMRHRTSTPRRRLTERRFA